MLAQFGIGGPSQAQQAEEADKIAVSKVWTRPKGIAVANGKGGSGKTPTSLYLAAMFARLGGGMVLVDDNNTFRGAAGWQTENAAHGATKEDLIAALLALTGRSARLTWRASPTTRRRTATTFYSPARRSWRATRRSTTLSLMRSRSCFVVFIGLPSSTPATTSRHRTGCA